MLGVTQWGFIPQVEGILGLGAARSRCGLTSGVARKRGRSSGYRAGARGEGRTILYVTPINEAEKDPIPDILQLFFSARPFAVLDCHLLSYVCFPLGAVGRASCWQCVLQSCRKGAVLGYHAWNTSAVHT